MSHPHRADERTALYRLYNGDGTLLYIGITCNPKARWKAHAFTKAWWPDVARKEVEWHDSRSLAEAAEIATIKAELPLHNVDDSPIAPRHRDLEPDEVSVTDLKSSLTTFAKRAAFGELIWVVDRTRDRKAQAVLAPAELGELVEEAGGPDKAAAIIASHLQGGR